MLACLSLLRTTGGSPTTGLSGMALPVHSELRTPPEGADLSFLTSPDQ